MTHDEMKWNGNSKIHRAKFDSFAINRLGLDEKLCTFLFIYIFHFELDNIFTHNFAYN